MNGTREYRKLESVLSANLPIGIKNAKAIPLTQNQVAIVDEDDYEKLMKWKWFALKDTNTFYAARYIVKGMIQMHREILGLKKYEKVIIDHINRDGLDNRKNNLRIATVSLNSYNKRMMTNNISGFRGVCWSKPHNRWVARVGINGKSVFCGQFVDVVLAAKAYDKKAKELWGDNAILNFKEAL